MKELFTEVKEKYKELSISLGQRKLLESEEDYISLTGFQGNKELEIMLTSQEEVERFKTLPVNELTILEDYVGLYYDNKLYLLIKSCRTFAPSLNHILRETIYFRMNYYDMALDISIGMQSSILEDFFSLCRTIRNRRHLTSILVVNNYLYAGDEKLTEDVRKISNSVLFDFYYVSNWQFELVNIEPVTRRPARIRGRSKITESRMDLTYKEYIPELIEYFRTAERVEYLPFKYLCYYNILEYFLDKSAYFIVAETIKSLLLKPDFHLKTDYYVGKAINVFKRENEKHISDKVKLNRVLQHYLDLDELIELLKGENLYDYFENSISMQCNKELILPKIDFNNRNQTITTLTNRIYALRCSIVHSNPDFDENKAIPFVPTPENLNKLRYELELVHEIAKSIILCSSIE